MMTSPHFDMAALLWRLKQAYQAHGDRRLSQVKLADVLADKKVLKQTLKEASESEHLDIRTFAQEGLLQLRGRKSSKPKNQKQSNHAGDDQTKQDDLLEEDKPTNALTVPILWKAGLITLVLLFLIPVILYSAGFINTSTLSLIPDNPYIDVSDNIVSNTVWKKGKIYRLNQVIFVDDKAKLEIEPGVRVEGQEGSALIVTRNARIQARGSSIEPIVFTSGKEPGTRQAGDWGGLVLLGNAPINREAAQIEGIDHTDPRGSFGGDQPEDSCGILDFVRIEFAGFEVYANNELNGLTLGGCGSNTIVRNVQVHRSLDDGIELFGGNTNLKQVLITQAGDDSLDWDMGWSGLVQFLVVQQGKDIGDNAFEADSNKSEPEALPISEPTMYNLTLIGGNNPNHAHRAMLLRRGTGGHFHNVIIDGFSREALDIRDAETVNGISEGRLEFSNILLNHCGPGGNDYFSDESGEKDDDSGFDEQQYFTSLDSLIFDRDPLLPSASTSLSFPNFIPSMRSVTAAQGKPLPEGEFWDEAANYLGAFRPGATQQWTAGWTDYPAN